MKNVISQSLGLDLININVYANVYQNIPLSSRDRVVFFFFVFVFFVVFFLFFFLRFQNLNLGNASANPK